MWAAFSIGNRYARMPLKVDALARNPIGTSTACERAVLLFVGKPPPPPARAGGVCAASAASVVCRIGDGTEVTLSVSSSRKAPAKVFADRAKYSGGILSSHNPGGHWCSEPRTSFLLFGRTTSAKQSPKISGSGSKARLLT